MAHPGSPGAVHRGQVPQNPPAWARSALTSNISARSTQLWDMLWLRNALDATSLRLLTAALQSCPHHRHRPQVWEWQCDTTRILRERTHVGCFRERRATRCRTAGSGWDLHIQALSHLSYDEDSLSRSGLQADMRVTATFSIGAAFPFSGT